MNNSSLRNYILPLIGLLFAIAALRIDGGLDRQPVDADLTLSTMCSYSTKGFPLAVTEQAIPFDGLACPTAQALTPLNMGMNWLFYSAVLLLGSLLVRPPIWMKRNQAFRLVGYSTSVAGLCFAGLFGWGMSVVLLGV